MNDYQIGFAYIEALTTNGKHEYNEMIKSWNNMLKLRETKGKGGSENK